MIPGIIPWIIHGGCFAQSLKSLSPGQGRISWGIHGLPKVSLEPPYAQALFAPQVATPDMTFWLFQGWLLAGWAPSMHSTTPLDTPCRKGMLPAPVSFVTSGPIPQSVHYAP
jgi:hypothetical protein